MQAGHHSARFSTRSLVTLAVLLAGASNASATWSILIVDGRSKEIAVGGATCLTGFDLQFNLPVVIVDVGAACAQSLVDVNASNRMVIWNELMDGTDPDDIIDILADINNQHQQRQYGIVDTRWRTTTFTGTGAGQWRGGAIGFTGDIYYAVQGNVLTGAPVVDMAEQAILNTPGDLPTKLMAAMEAARLMGGDGRCSCSPNNPTGCGAPPATFTKSSHIGFMVVARTGDTDGICTSGLGCANGDYWMGFNVANQSATDPDPVFQLQELFDEFRLDYIGKPDAVHSIVEVVPPAVPGQAAHSSVMTITLRDWQNAITNFEIKSLTVEHAPGSAQLATIGDATSIADGVYQVELVTPGGVGRDRFHVTVDDGIRPIILIPLPELISAARSDFDFDGDVDETDFQPLRSCMAGPGQPILPNCPQADFDSDSDIDLGDFSVFQNEFTAPPCRLLHLIQPPVQSFHMCGTSFDVTTDVIGDPTPQYQWFLDGNPIPGATGAVYHVESATNSDHGYYHVRISNTCESILTVPVLVRVFPNPCP